MRFSRLLEANSLPPGFTGKAPPDAKGRVYYYENGKRVKQMDDQKVATKKEKDTKVEVPPTPQEKGEQKEDQNAVKSPEFIGKVKDKVSKFAELLKKDAKGVLTQLKKDFGLPDWGAEKRQEAELIARASQVSRKKTDVEVPQMGKLVGVTKAKSKVPDFNPRTHLLPEERHLIRKKLGSDGWVLRKITENDLNAMRDLYKRVRDEGQKAALLHAFDMMSIAKREGGEAYVPKGKIRQRPSVPHGVSPATKETAKEAAGSPPPPAPTETPTSPSATPPMATSTPTSAPPTGNPGRIGLDTPDPNFQQKPGVLNTFSAISHRSPKVKKTDKERTPGELAYFNTIHNQLEPTREELQSLHDEAGKLDLDKQSNLANRLGVDWNEERRKAGIQSGQRVPRGFRAGVLQKYLKQLIDAGPQGPPPTKAEPTRGKDMRYSKYDRAGKTRFPHFRPVKGEDNESK